MKTLRLIVSVLVLTAFSAAYAQQSVAPPPRPVDISSGVMAGMLLEKTNPVYPPTAKAAHVSGTVVLQATITKAGMIENLHVISGPDLLQQASLEAVKAWRYRPYLLMGEPVEVQTTINVIFTLGGNPPQSSPAAGSQEAAPPLAQTTAVPPPPMPAADGPSLAATMQFIQNKLQEYGKINFAMYTHDNADGKDFVDQVIVALSLVVADPATCRLSYHKTASANNGAPQGNDVTINLREVQNLIVMTGDAAQTKLNAEQGHPTRNVTVQPPIFVLAVRKAGNQENWFYLSDEEMTNRIAKAMVHAVELCGGGEKQELF